jgi:hypothetical protein
MSISTSETNHFVNDETTLPESSSKPVIEKRTIPGFEKYSVDSYGNVYGQDGNKLRQQNSAREASVHLYTAPGIKKVQKVHRLVLLAFVGPPPTSKHTGDHIDRNPKNNVLQNMRWATKEEQIRNSSNCLEPGKEGVNAQRYVVATSDEEVIEFRGFTAAVKFIKNKLNLKDADGTVRTRIQRSIKGSKPLYSFSWSYKSYDLGTVKPIPAEVTGVKGYSVTTNGYIVSPTGRATLGYLHPDGYHRIGIKGKQYKVSRLVAFTFVKNKRPGLANIANHIDGNKQNNHAANLEWATDAENVQHAYDTGLIGPQHKQRKISQFDLKTGAFLCEYKSIREAARAVPACSAERITKCLKGVTTSIEGYVWKYAGDQSHSENTQQV